MASWVIDPKTGDYVMGANGAPQSSEELTMPAYYRLKVKRTQWQYAPDNQFGSDFYLQTKRKSTQDASYYETIAQKALQPIVDDGRSSSITVTTVALARNGIGMKTEILDAQGQTEKVVVVPIGG